MFEQAARKNGLALKDVLQSAGMVVPAAETPPSKKARGASPSPAGISTSVGGCSSAAASTAGESAAASTAEEVDDLFSHPGTEAEEEEDQIGEEDMEEEARELDLVTEPEGPEEEKAATDVEITEEDFWQALKEPPDEEQKEQEADGGETGPQETTAEQEEDEDAEEDEEVEEDAEDEEGEEGEAKAQGHEDEEEQDENGPPYMYG